MIFNWETHEKLLNQYNSKYDTSEITEEDSSQSTWNNLMECITTCINTDLYNEAKAKKNSRDIPDIVLTKILVLTTFKRYLEKLEDDEIFIYA